MPLIVDNLLQPISDNQPAGTDVQYDRRFTGLCDLIKGSLRYDGQGANEIAVFESPDWCALKEIADELGSETRDLRLWIILTRIYAALEGVSGLASGLELIRQGFETMWDHLRPELDTFETDSSERALMRLNAMQAMSDPHGLIREVYAMPLVVAEGIGEFNLRQLLLAHGKVHPNKGEGVPELGLVRAAMERAQDFDAVRENVARARNEAQLIENFLADRLSIGAGDLTPIKEALDAMASVLGASRPAVVATAAGAAVAGGAAPMVTTLAAPAQIETREQVIDALGRIQSYYERKEPTSPIPLLIERVQRLVPMSFMELMADMAPSAVKQLEEIAGTDGRDVKSKSRRAAAEEEK